ncbi:hypothetical protein NE237_008603 [Protea cynaroides]|uniref:Homeobox domain-containing protein n=1 Tax=Protea cynaroides TaxID=273540 RepID=A0A9Q0KW04_9MAGN|nr:hypothetical protein NE237_008603 [Protea cynaroides]
MPPTASTRWSPTPEQLMILEELYRRGIRTPTASQILHITTHLSLYGKIEGKNVFYWFQNHKARDRQKLRRKLLRQQQQQQHQQQQQQQQTLHHDLFHQIESPPLLQLPPLNDQTQFLPQGGDSSNQMIMGDYGWKMIDSSSSKRMELEKPNTIYAEKLALRFHHQVSISKTLIDLRWGTCGLNHNRVRAIALGWMVGMVSWFSSIDKHRNNVVFT